jgi:hypothetical protein
VTNEQQAQYLVRAIAVMRVRYSYVEEAFWYKDASRPGESVHESGYGSCAPISLGALPTPR